MSERHCWLRLRPHQWDFDHEEGSNGVLYSTSVYICRKCSAEKCYYPDPVEIR